MDNIAHLLDLVEQWQEIDLLNEEGELKEIVNAIDAIDIPSLRVELEALKEQK